MKDNKTCEHSKWWKIKNTIIGTICLKCRYRKPHHFIAEPKPERGDFKCNWRKATYIAFITIFPQPTGNHIDKI